MKISVQKILGYISYMLVMIIINTLILRTINASTTLSYTEELVTLVLVIGVVTAFITEIARRFGLFRQPQK